MKNKLLFLFLFVVLAVSLATAYHLNSYKREPLSIYIPCGMIMPFQEAIKEFKTANRGAQIDAHFDNGAVLVRLILDKNKRPDIFVSTGAVEMRNLIDRGLINAASIRELGVFNLVLYTSNANPAGVSGLNSLKEAKVKAIALADPRFNSVGSCAVKLLEQTGLMQAIKEKIVYTESPIQALALVSSGKAEAGIHFDTCPFDTAPEKMPAESVKVIATFNKPPGIASEIAILNNAKNDELARVFLDFLFSNRGRKVLEKNGIRLREFKEKITAKANIVAYYPLNEEHQFIADYLKSLENKFPGEVSVRVVDFRTPDGYEEWRKTGLVCAGIFINGKSMFTIETAEGKKEVKFLRRMDTFWSKEDLEKVIENEIKT